MKQLLQNLGSGVTELVDSPVPLVGRHSVLIETEHSLVSLGTERMLVEFGQAGLVGKALAQREKVVQVLEKAKTDGVAATYAAVRDKLDQPITLGYCNAGRVLEVGAAVEGIRVGDRVVSNGSHSEIVRVGQNLVALIPDGVESSFACFAVPGSIALQGIRLLQPTLGERFVVLGLGLVGQLAIQLLRAHGGKVLGVDLDPAKCALAESFGIEVYCPSSGGSLIEAAEGFSGGVGVDGVLITASTKSSDPVNQAAEICRKRGRIIQIGATGLDLKRAQFYDKELHFQVSCSYGPGRYDPDYEQGGRDYPLPYVRWTEHRNISAVLDQMAAGNLRVEPLITLRVPFAEAPSVYEDISNSSRIGIVLDYQVAGIKPSPESKQSSIQIGAYHPSSGKHPVVAVIGAGVFTGRMLLPALKKTGAVLHTIVSSGGVTAGHFGRKFGFSTIATDIEEVWRNKDINTVFVTTRHDTHASFAIRALREGKNVFIEKPLCLNRSELDEIISARSEFQEPMLMVGFNRRFSPFIVEMRKRLSPLREPKTLVLTINAGVMPLDHWHHDPAVGGGRIIAEGCHFIDLLRFLVGHPIVNVQATMIGESPYAAVRNDKTSITLTFADGSIGTVHYFGNGAKNYPKERIEAFCGGQVLVVENFLRLRSYGWKGARNRRVFKQDKGHGAEIAAFVEAIREGGAAPIPFEEIVESMQRTFDAVESADRS